MPSCGVCVCVCVCLCVCHVRELCQNEYRYLRIFFTFGQPHHSSFIRTKRDGDIPTGTLLTNAGGVGRNRHSEPMPAVDVATGKVSQTWSPVDDGHHLASCDTYIAGRILRVFDHQSPRAIKSPSPWFFSARTTNHALALYTITIDRMYDEKKNTVPPDRVKL